MLARVLAVVLGLSVSVYTVFRKKWYSCISIYFSQVRDKFYETFMEYLEVNMSTNGNLILTESVKYSLCSYEIVTFCKNRDSEVV